MDWRYRRKLIEQTIVAKELSTSVEESSASRPITAGPSQVSNAVLMRQIAQRACFACSAALCYTWEHAPRGALL